MDVKRGPILFRCDATPEVGYEPFYQCVTLAACLQRRRRGTHFFSYLEPLSLAPGLARGNNDWAPAENLLGSAADIEATKREVRRLAAAAVVIAGDVTAEYVDEIRRTGATVLAVDTAAATPLPANIVLNPLLAPGRKAYTAEGDTQLLLGRKFALVKGLFRRQRTIRATEQPAPYRALVAFGDDDAGDQTLLRTQQLLEMPKVEKVSVAVRTHHPRYDELRELASASKSRVDVVTEPKELMTRLVRAHFAVTSGCPWALEIACVGIPQLVLPTTPTHQMTAKRMDDEGAATFLGAAADVAFDQLYEAVALLLDDPMERLGMSRCARYLIDGRGGDRVVNGLEIVLHTPRFKQAERLRLAA